MGVTCKIRRVDAATFEASEPDNLYDMLRYGTPGVRDLDKAWDGVLWLISEERRTMPYMLPDPDLPETRSLMPTSSAKASGSRIAWTTPEEVAEIAEALDAIDEAALRGQFDPAAMTKAEVYPDIWHGEPDALDYLVAHFLGLRDVYREAAANDAYVLVLIE